ncbi:uncharacterized protein APUU_21401A [Aspergillus puulaauensis]|uniref:Uncharacterized protein n=1 Tax=Aspergillus puulaauensis TaxID=1220207 RepID=A0A7R7XHZ2_9EURO|nr:uncharacterized protein APUU_21401A [Aspergillus puulaauensis]BCS20969.1 hypothetical protein APUU_21401A [Aspergillus puulaauensis]
MSFPRFRIQNTSKPSRLEDDIVPLTESKSTPVSRTNSFAMKTLNPRRLSIRLKNRPSKSPAPSPSHSPAPYEANYNHSSPVYRPHTDPLPSPNPAAVSIPASTGGGSRTGAEFIYKPIRRTDYVPETATSQNQSQNQRPRPQYQYNYISPKTGNRSPHLAAGTWGHAGLPVGPAPQSRSQSRAQAQLEDRRDLDLYNDLDIAVPRGRTEYNYTEKSMYTAAEKKRRAARRLTTVMVPDAEDIYG